jgi:hypothetical protein
MIIEQHAGRQAAELLDQRLQLGKRFPRDGVASRLDGLDRQRFALLSRGNVPHDNGSRPIWGIERLPVMAPVGAMRR